MRISGLQTQFKVGRIFNNTHADSIKNFKNEIVFKGEEAKNIDIVTLTPSEVPEQRIQRIEKVAQKALEKTGPIFDEIEGLTKESKEIKRRAEVELSKVEKKKGIIQGLIEKGNSEGFEGFKYDSNRVEFRSTDGISKYNLTLDEYDDASNKLIRSTTFDAITLQPRTIEEYTKREGINRYEFSSSSNAVIKISRGISENSKGTTARREYSYSQDGSLKRFVKKNRVDKQGNTSKDEHWYFSNNNLSYYSKKQTDNKDGSSEMEKEFNFVLDNLKTYKENIRFDKNRIQVSGETYTFKNGSLAHYSKAQAPTEETEGKVEYFDYDNGQFWRYHNNQEVIEF